MRDLTIFQNPDSTSRRHSLFIVVVYNVGDFAYRLRYVKNIGTLNVHELF